MVSIISTLEDLRAFWPYHTSAIIASNGSTYKGTEAQYLCILRLDNRIFSFRYSFVTLPSRIAILLCLFNKLMLRLIFAVLCICS